MDTGVICVLNVFNRPQWFQEQLAAIKNQTVKPKKIIIWNNNDSINLNMFKSDPQILILSTSQNLGVWARFFSLYYLFNAKYICVFDDDTIPQKRWFENCIETIEKHNALLGTIGIVYKQGNRYESEFKYGWEGYLLDDPNNVGKTNYVDVVGHSWFFRKEWITTLVKELPNIDEEMFVCGEDMHLSYVLQKYLHIPTMVPPHPLDNRELWGAVPEKSKYYGNVNSTYSKFSSDGRFHKAIAKYISNGYETIMNKYNNIKIWNNCLNYFINKIKNKDNFSLLRFADGELSILQNRTLTNCDNWTFKTGNILHRHLNSALELKNTNVYYGISGLSDNKDACNYYYNNIFNTHNITYANVFVNSNYKKWIEFLESYSANCFLISSAIPNNNKIGNIKIIDSLIINEFLVNNWDNEYKNYFNMLEKIAKKYTNMLFLISAGPLSEVFIYKLYKANPNNIYLDVGSSIDTYVKNKQTRPYMKDSNLINNTIMNLPIIR